MAFAKGGGMLQNAKVDELNRYVISHDVTWWMLSLCHMMSCDITIHVYMCLFTGDSKPWYRLPTWRFLRTVYRICVVWMPSNIAISWRVQLFASKVESL
jgi:hypothetical protein